MHGGKPQNIMRPSSLRSAKPGQNTNSSPEAKLRRQVKLEDAETSLPGCRLLNDPFFFGLETATLIVP